MTVVGQDHTHTALRNMLGGAGTDAATPTCNDDNAHVLFLCASNEDPAY
jgi:hypothetical protein